jgi:hypothetical protein
MLIVRKAATVIAWVVFASVSLYLGLVGVLVAEALAAETAALHVCDNAPTKYGRIHSCGYS